MLQEGRRSRLIAHEVSMGERVIEGNSVILNSEYHARTVNRKRHREVEGRHKLHHYGNHRHCRSKCGRLQARDVNRNNDGYNSRASLLVQSGSIRTKDRTSENPPIGCSEARPVPSIARQWPEPIEVAVVEIESAAAGDRNSGSVGTGHST